jgi:hypothetical protein
LQALISQKKFVRLEKQNFHFDCLVAGGPDDFSKSEAILKIGMLQYSEVPRSTDSDDFVEIRSDTDNQHVRSKISKNLSPVNNKLCSSSIKTVE